MASTSAKRTRLADAGLSLGSIIVTLLIVELIVRIFWPQTGSFYQSDQTLGARLRPNAKGIATTEGKRVPITINEYGYRGWQYPQQKMANVTRIAVLGDSYIEALQMPEDKIATKLLENQLNQDAQKKHEVLAFGVSGYGTTQSYLTYQTYAKQFQPDSVVLTITSGNDIRNNVKKFEQEDQKPYFTIENNELVLNQPVLKESLLKKINKLALNSSHLYRLVIFRAMRLPFLQKNLANNNMPTDYNVYRCEYDAEWENAWAITKKILSQFRQEVESSGSQFFVVNLTSFLPIHGQSALEELYKQYPAMKDQCWDLEKPNKILKEFAEQNSIKYLDLLPAFKKDYEQTMQEAHLLVDGHWNEHGHELAASLMKEFLTR